MDKDSDKKGGGEKKGGGGGSGAGGQSGGTGLGGAAGVNDPAALLDAASLFGKYHEQTTRGPPAFEPVTLVTDGLECLKTKTGQCMGHLDSK